MNYSNIWPFSKKPNAVILSSYCALSISIVETFLSNFCKTTIITDEVDVWMDKASHILDNESLQIASFQNINQLEEVSYLVFVGKYYFNRSPLKDELIRIKEGIELARKQFSKTLFLFPLYKDEVDKEILALAEHAIKDETITAGIVYTGEIYGPRMNINKQSIVAKAIKNLINEFEISLPRQDNRLLLTHIPDFSRRLVRGLLSFGTIGQKTLYYSFDNKLNVFSQLINKIGGKVVKNSIASQKYIRVKNKLNLNTNVIRTINETVNWVNRYGCQVDGEEVVSKEATGIKLGLDNIVKRVVENFSIAFEKRPRGIIKKRGFVLVAFLVLTFLTPYLLIAGSSGAMYLGIRQINKGSVNGALRSFTTANRLSEASYKITNFSSNLPILSFAYNPAFNASGMLSKASSLFSDGLLMLGKISSIAANVVSGKPTKPSLLTEGMVLEIDYFYQELAFLESELSTLNNNNIYKKIFENNQFNLSTVRSKLLEIKTIIKELPEALGEYGPKVYLVMFQNNMELRPTGGFIGSFALISFNQGTLEDVLVYDVYSADGQLKGHVEPPEPIKNYLGEANWFLRDSNWNPDFRSTAENVEWFLDKEINENVDGVVGIDLEFARQILEVVGPTYIADFDKKVDSNNLYELTQKEVEGNFFPGSRKKASFLTALAEELINSISRIERNDIPSLFEKVYLLLEERHMQMFLHDNILNNAVANLGWDGGVNVPYCGESCFSDYLGLVEANLGVNKANLFINRQMNLDIYLDGDRVKRRLTIDYQNSANNSMVKNGRYKNYLRILLPPGNEIESAAIVNYDGYKELDFDKINLSGRQEIGVLIEVLPESRKKIVFVWSQNNTISFQNKGSYQLKWRKQAGTIADPINVNIVLPQGVKTRGIPQPSLTRENYVSYNTVLTRDFGSRIFW